MAVWPHFKVFSHIAGATPKWLRGWTVGVSDVGLVRCKVQVWVDVGIGSWDLRDAVRVFRS